MIGAGFGGIAAAVAVGNDADTVVLERGADVGGVWRENGYPGAACDIPSHLYSYSFAPEHRWSRRFAPQPDILRYLRHEMGHVVNYAYRLYDEEEWVKTFG